MLMKAVGSAAFQRYLQTKFRPVYTESSGRIRVNPRRNISRTIPRLAPVEPDRVSSCRQTVIDPHLFCCSDCGAAVFQHGAQPVFRPVVDYRPVRPPATKRAVCGSERAAPPLAQACQPMKLQISAFELRQDRPADGCGDNRLRLFRPFPSHKGGTVEIRVARRTGDEGQRPADDFQHLLMEALSDVEMMRHPSLLGTGDKKESA